MKTEFQPCASHVGTLGIVVRLACVLERHIVDTS